MLGGIFYALTAFFLVEKKCLDNLSGFSVDLPPKIWAALQGLNREERCETVADPPL